MMRIKDAIQRRKLIQQLNDEYADLDAERNLANAELGEGKGAHGAGGGICPKQSLSQGPLGVTQAQALVDHQHAYLALYEFVNELNQRLTDGHRRALRITWKRLSEAPKTSGRGTLKIMEKVFAEIVTKNSQVMPVFYRAAFLKCIEDRRNGYGKYGGNGTIATVRDHAHLLIDLIDGIMCVMFDAPFVKPVWDPATIGRAHARLVPMGLEREMWHRLGECFAEVMFSQECVRAYPHAASAWSMLSVAITDKMFSHSRIARSTDLAVRSSRIAAVASTLASRQPSIVSHQPSPPMRHRGRRQSVLPPGKRSKSKDSHHSRSSNASKSLAAVQARRRSTALSRVEQLRSPMKPRPILGKQKTMFSPIRSSKAIGITSPYSSFDFSPLQSQITAISPIKPINPSYGLISSSSLYNSSLTNNVSQGRTQSDKRRSPTPRQTRRLRELMADSSGGSSSTGG
ncbi:globin-like protein 9 [Ditylenchus destructor]|uniref:Globin-like protein 9 n=1 Tax=Ditylenchus destructor TaxID=166010 RepID=A0AAD4MSM9_9BILA|nr:globin-like protein 9 [Ditylenchus destructor]